MLQAFLLELGIILFFLPYTMLYNWVYDILRERIVERRSARKMASTLR